MALDPLSWAIGFTLTRTVTWRLKKAGTETVSEHLHEAVLKSWEGLRPMRGLWFPLQGLKRV